MVVQLSNIIGDCWALGGMYGLLILLMRLGSS
jgi:hypothetical protein